MKLSTTTLALFLSSTIAISASGLISSPPKKSNSVRTTLKAQSFKVDNQASKIGWLAKKATGEHNGNISINSGALQLQNNVLTAIALDIDTRTITDIDLTEKADNDKLVATLKSETFFNSDKFPKASLVTTSIVHNAGQQYTINGKLTIKGITNDISFPATVGVNGKKLNATAKISIDRTKYDIKFRSKSFFENLGDKVIYDNFDLDVALTANAQ